MKKMISMILVLATVFTLVASIASAADYDIQSTFGYVSITCASGAEKRLNVYEPGYKTAKEKVLYVRHYLYGSYGGTYSNYFRAKNASSASNPLLGGNWMAPDTANYVRSSSILANGLNRYHAFGRGNTDYGLNSITISGYCHANS